MSGSGAQVGTKRHGNACDYVQLLKLAVPLRRDQRSIPLHSLTDRDTHPARNRSHQGAAIGELDFYAVFLHGLLHGPSTELLGH